MTARGAFRVVSKRRQDRRPLKRRKSYLTPKHRILVACEGRVTEPSYLKAYQHEVHNPRVHVEFAKETGVPLTVVEAAIRGRDKARQQAKAERDDNHLFEEVWAVFDVDEHPLEEAVSAADREQIQLAVSNPCFELWAVLHFSEQTSHIGREAVRRSLQQFMPKYEKKLDFSRLKGRYEDAKRRAVQLDRAEDKHGRQVGSNPSTRIYKLTEAIRLGGGGTSAGKEPQSHSEPPSGS